MGKSAASFLHRRSARQSLSVTDDCNYRIEFRWKEQVIYWEGDSGFIFDGGWGFAHR